MAEREAAAWSGPPSREERWLRIGERETDKQPTEKEKPMTEHAHLEIPVEEVRQGDLLDLPGYDEPVPVTQDADTRTYSVGYRTGNVAVNWHLVHVMTAARGVLRCEGEIVRVVRRG